MIPAFAFEVHAVSGMRRRIGIEPRAPHPLSRAQRARAARHPRRARQTPVRVRGGPGAARGLSARGATAAACLPAPFITAKAAWASATVAGSLLQTAKRRPRDTFFEREGATVPAWWPVALAAPARPVGPP